MFVFVFCYFIGYANYKVKTCINGTVLVKKIQNIWVVVQREAFEIINRICFTTELYNPIKQPTTVKNHLLSTLWHRCIRKMGKLRDF